MSGSSRLKVAVVTGGRAEYGLLRWLIADLVADPDIDCQIIATGAHLVPEAGLTFRAIEGDGFRITRKVEMQLASDTGVGMAKSAGLGALSYADTFSDLAPDIVVLLGDRYEIAAAALAAYLMNIPVAHIYGGEKTEGAVDDALRHIITKCARLHFTAAEDYRRRVIQLGEPPETVFNTGAPGLDSIHRLALYSHEETLRRLGLAPDARYLLTTYHPVTTDEVESRNGMKALLDAFDAFPEYAIVLTRPNQDAGAREIGAMVDDFAAQHADRVRVSASLGQMLYLSAMKYCEAVIGNSSSGIVEAPALRRPTVDIGTRQKGRLKSASIIECQPELASIIEAIQKALSPAFAETVRDAPLCYGDADASRKIYEIIKDRAKRIQGAKSFFDLPVPH